jgi:hypothetical protein
MKIAIIDSGINPDHPHVRGVGDGVFIHPTGESRDYLDRLGHGTAVAAAIREKAPDAKLYAVRVFGHALATSIQVIARAIEWSIAQQVDIINLSLGTRNPAHRPRFERIVAQAGGVVFVSAFEQDGHPLLPGALDGVVGVRLDWDCPRDRYRVEGRGGRAIFRASGFPRSIPGVPQQKNLNGTSFAVANMTGFVAHALSEGATPPTLLARLIERAAECRVA